jgi:hypothetical protein
MLCTMRRGTMAEQSGPHSYVADFAVTAASLHVARLIGSHAADTSARAPRRKAQEI